MRGVTMNDTKAHKSAIAEGTMQLVAFRVGAGEYGLGMRSITEVVRPLKIMPLPWMRRREMPDFDGLEKSPGAAMPRGAGKHMPRMFFCAKRNASRPARPQ